MPISRKRILSTWLLVHRLFEYELISPVSLATRITNHLYALWNQRPLLGEWIVNENTSIACQGPADSISNINHTRREKQSALINFINFSDHFDCWPSRTSTATLLFTVDLCQVGRDATSRVIKMSMMWNVISCYPESGYRRLGWQLARAQWRNNGPRGRVSSLPVKMDADNNLPLALQLVKLYRLTGPCDVDTSSEKLEYKPSNVPTKSKRRWVGARNQCSYMFWIYCTLVVCTSGNRNLFEV